MRWMPILAVRQILAEFPDPALLVAIGWRPVMPSGYSDAIRWATSNTREAAGTPYRRSQEGTEG